jgi:hypothetical protein
LLETYKPPRRREREEVTQREANPLGQLGNSYTLDWLAARALRKNPAEVLAMPIKDNEPKYGY